MAFLIGGANSAVDAAYSVDNSCRFNRADSPKHEKDLGTSTDDKKHTFSCWFKKSENSVSSSEHGLMNSATDSNNFVNCMFHSSDTFQYFAKIGGSTAMQLKPSPLFRDNSAWSNIVIGVDTSQSTASNRVKIYINGTQVTSWVTETYPSQDAVLDTNESGAAIQIGSMRGPANYFHGYMAEVVFIDGLQYAASDFGEFSEDSPTIWMPKDVSELTFGTNGFYLDFEDSANLGNDANGGTDLTETNLAAADQAKDTPVNNFCTLNPLDSAGYLGTAPTISEGNLKFASSGAGAGNNNAIRATIAVSNGKWYWESKWIQNNTGWGMQNTDAGTRWDAQGYWVGIAGGWGNDNGGGKQVNGSVTGSIFTALSANDIIGLAFDLDNQKFYLSVNGTFVTSGDPTSGATGTGSLGDLTAGLSYIPIVGNGDYDNSSIVEMNFGGCPSFAISSAAADANGYGTFEFAPPSGYFALCTKNLATYG